MKVNSLHDLLVEELKDIYDAEKQIVKALPKLIEAVAAEELETALTDHLEETKIQVQRLEQVFTDFGIKPGRKRCEAMQGLIEEADHMVSQVADETARDAAIICAAQKIEHYEIATYGCIRTWAEALGHDGLSGMLQESLDEEGDADKKLTHIADALNARAVGAAEEDL
jgi:ferritin-like metal-binding protein YciE